MITIKDAHVWGFQHAIRGMRNPLNSWNKSDSWTYPCGCHCDKCCYSDRCVADIDSSSCFVIGDNDFHLMQKLFKAGTDHRKFTRQIMVSMDVEAPLYWWKEFDTYKVGTVSNSCSTMHKIHSKEFTLDDFSHEHLDSTTKEFFKSIIQYLNYSREKFNESKDKDHWWNMIQLLPTSFNQKRTITLNYEVLANIYNSRKSHKLDEWHLFCDWILTLPMMKNLLIGGDSK